MSTALRIMTQHGSASSALHPHPHGSEETSLPEGGVAEAYFKIWVGFSFLVCLLNLVIIVSSGSKKSERKQLSSGKTLQQAGWRSTTGRLAFCFLPEHLRPTLKNERAWQNPGEDPTVWKNPGEDPTVS